MRTANRIWRAFAIMTVLFSIFNVTACRDLSGVAGKRGLPAGIPDPSSFDNPAGALALYHGALCYLYPCTSVTGGDASSLPIRTDGYGGVFPAFVILSGLFSDELQSNNLGGDGLQYLGVSGSFRGLWLDARQVPEGFGTETSFPTGLESVYRNLQQLRGYANLAIGALTMYGTGLSQALRGELYSAQGYAELMLADLYCSGVPLSTLNYKGDFTYKVGSTTEETYKHAIALFDSALTLSVDSVRALNLARVGKARALLSIGHYIEAAQVVEAVPTEWAYSFGINWKVTSTQDRLTVANVTMSDAEGGVGIPYLSSRDPRTLGVANGINKIKPPVNTSDGTVWDTLYFPEKYGTPASTAARPIVLANGIEARLIQAEAALHDNDVSDWLMKLNTLRTTCTARADCPTPAPAGTGGVSGLSLLDDPGSDSARVSVMLRERAYWLYLTGHRQGDLRRLMRNYSRQLEQTYPTGDFPAPGVIRAYGGYVDLPIPAEEYRNPQFHGCLKRGE